MAWALGDPFPLAWWLVLVRVCLNKKRGRFTGTALRFYILVTAVLLTSFD